MAKSVCAIVGAGSGIGLAVAKRFAREGFCVALLARRADELEGYAATLRKEGADARGFPADAGDFASLEGALTQIDQDLGAPDVLVYNAAALRRGAPTTLSGDDLIADFKVSVAGALVCAKHVAAAMRERKRGTILLTGGGLALSPHPDFASLAIGKAGIRSLAGSLAGELEPAGIHVATVTICGFVKPGTHFDPDKIADVYFTLHSQGLGQWEREVIYK
ncbi:MAG: SDR family NAD(P)-dependent oxidoreductase [Polyangiaceae bacterium]|nr:SDR family NAD(P)-dependent oxidoreductase [Polyangiaceae bacterium]NUQ72272.1 SDR family NAD(P)-dependent oxidoreductase [Polyangiaceae bacterium]